MASIAACSDSDVGSGECLIVCGGFEDRAVEVLRRTCQRGARELDVGLIKYLPENAEKQIG